MQRTPSVYSPCCYLLFELISFSSTGKINCVIHYNHKTHSALPENSAELLPAGTGNWATCLVYLLTYTHLAYFAMIHLERSGSDGTAPKEEPGWERRLGSRNCLPDNLGSGLASFPLPLSSLMGFLPRNPEHFGTFSTGQWDWSFGGMGDSGQVPRKPPRAQGTAAEP